MPSLTRATTTPAEEATSLLYERYTRRIFGFALRRLGTREEADDAVQTTFLYAFRSLQRGVAPRHELAWLLKIAENVCRARRRSTQRRGGHETPVDPCAFDAVSARQRSADELFSLPEALAEMPPTQRRAILLREWRGLSYQEIADDLGVSQSAVETLLFRARRSLATRLERALRSLLGPFGFLRPLLGGGAAKIAVTVAVVAGTSVVAVPHSPRGNAQAEPGSRPQAAAEPRLQGRRGPAHAAGAASVRSPLAVRKSHARPTRAPAPRSSTTPAVAGTRPAAPGPEATGPSLPGPVSEASTGAAADRPPGTTATGTVGGTANTPAGTVETTVSTTSDPLPEATVDAGVSTPAGTVEVTARVDPTASDPVTGEVTAPPLPPPPPLPPLP